MEDVKSVRQCAIFCFAPSRALGQRMRKSYPMRTYISNRCILIIAHWRARWCWFFVHIPPNIAPTFCGRVQISTDTSSSVVYRRNTITLNILVVFAFLPSGFCVAATEVVCTSSLYPRLETVLLPMAMACAAAAAACNDIRNEMVLMLCCLFVNLPNRMHGSPHKLREPEVDFQNIPCE